MHKKARVQWEDLEISNWWDGESQEFQDLVLRFLATLPGGDELEELGYVPFRGVGWPETNMLTELLGKIQDNRDVENIIESLFGKYVEP